MRYIHAMGKTPPMPRHAIVELHEDGTGEEIAWFYTQQDAERFRHLDNTNAILRNANRGLARQVSELRKQLSLEQTAYRELRQMTRNDLRHQRGMDETRFGPRYGPVDPQAGMD